MRRGGHKETSEDVRKVNEKRMRKKEGEDEQEQMDKERSKEERRKGIGDDKRN